MQTTKCVWSYHDKQSEFKPAFDYFHSIVNEGIRIGIEKNITSKFALHKELYYRFRSEFHSKIIYGALECASSRIKTFRKVRKKIQHSKIPHVIKPHLVLDNQSYKIIDDSIRIPIKPRQYIFVRLNSYIISVIQGMKLGSITVTENKIVISCSKNIPEQKPTDFIAIDRNLNNATTFDTKNNFEMHDLRQATKIKENYRKIKSHFKRNDVRIRRKIFAKYGKKERNRVHNILHQTSKKIVNQNMGIILEDIRGIRKLYRSGNGQGKRFRGKMNSWSFYELQRQIQYKASWLGLPVKFVNANGTSSKCATCGSKTVPEEHRMLFCSCCNVVVDRDINAAKNVLVRGTRVVPVGAASEAMVEEPLQKVILKVDAVQSSHQTKT